MKLSAGLLMYRQKKGRLEVFIGHHGGPFFDNWTIPKGEIEDGEDHLTTAKREFTEETGLKIPDNTCFIDLGSIVQKNQKTVFAWAFEYRGGNNSPAIKSNLTKFGWPELDKASFFCVEEAKSLIYSTQKTFIERLESILTP